MVSVSPDVYEFHRLAEDAGETYLVELRFVSEPETGAALQLVRSAVTDLMEMVAREQFQPDAEEFYPGIWAVNEFGGWPVICIEDDPTDFPAILARFCQTLERLGASGRLELEHAYGLRATWQQSRAECPCMAEARGEWLYFSAGVRWIGAFDRYDASQLLRFLGEGHDEVNAAEFLHTRGDSDLRFERCDDLVRVYDHGTAIADLLPQDLDSLRELITDHLAQPTRK
jgi:hypothetical protein